MDEMTGVLSKSVAEEKVGTIVGRGTPGTFLLLSLVRRGEIAARYGEEAAEKLSLAFVKLLRSIKRQSDIIGQLDEDEYVLYYTRKQPEDFLRDKCEFLNASLHAMTVNIVGEETDIAFGTSIGIVRVPDEGRSFATLYAKAKEALDEVLASERLGYEIYYDANRSSIGDEEVSPALSIIKTRITEPGTPPGAYRVRTNEFTVLYQFCQRFCPDMQICAGMVLFAMKKRSKSELSDEEVRGIFDDFYKRLYSSLRRRDVVTRYSEDQALAVFTAEDEFGLHAAIERILDSWKEQPGAKEIHVEAEMLVLMGD